MTLSNKRNIICRTLLGTKNLDFSLECLNSFIQNSYDLIRLEIFEDGTMEDSHIKRIESFLENTVVITKKSREAKILDKLSNYPQCLNFRKHNVFAYKLLDTMLYDNNDFFYIDTDIFIIKKFILPDFDVYPIFMKDLQNGYFFEPALFFKIDSPILPYVNAGFSYFPNSLFNLTLVESLFKKHFTTATINHAWAEQTMWAFLAAECEKTYYFNSEQVVLATNNMVINKKAIAIHLVTGTRFHLDSLRALSDSFSKNTGYDKIETQLITSNLSNFEFTFSWLKTKLASINRRLSKANLKVNS